MKKLRWMILVLLFACVPAAVEAAPAGFDYSTAFLHPMPAQGGGIPRIFAQVTSHGTTLTWSASPSAAACQSTNTPPCSFGYNVFRGSTTGGEGATPVNSAPITGNSYFDPVTLTNAPQTFFYTVGAVETVGTVTALSLTNSNEVSASFPGAPAPPVLATPSTK